MMIVPTLAQPLPPAVKSVLRIAYVNHTVMVLMSKEWIFLQPHLPTHPSPLVPPNFPPPQSEQEQGVICLQVATA